MKRGELYYANLHDRLDHVQDGTRLVLVIQNDIGNYYSPNTIIIPLTTKLKKLEQPTHVLIKEAPTLSMALCEQILTINKNDLGDYIGKLYDTTLARINNALLVSIGVTI